MSDALALNAVSEAVRSLAAQQLVLGDKIGNVVVAAGKAYVGYGFVGGQKQLFRLIYSYAVKIFFEAFACYTLEGA